MENHWQFFLNNFFGSLHFFCLLWIWISTLIQYWFFFETFPFQNGAQSVLQPFLPYPLSPCLFLCVILNRTNILLFREFTRSLLTVLIAFNAIWMTFQTSDSLFWTFLIFSTILLCSLAGTCFWLANSCCLFLSAIKAMYLL